MISKIFFLVSFRISHAFSWKFIKNNIQSLITDVIFPLMCHSEEDEDQWNNDPLEYIRIKYGKVGPSLWSYHVYALQDYC